MSDSPKDLTVPTLALHGHLGWVNCVAISPEGFRAASGGEDGTLRTWQIYDGKQLDVCDLGSPVKSVCYGDDDLTLAAGCKNGTIRYWGGLSTGLQSGTMQGAEDLESGWIQALNYIPEKGSIIFSVQPANSELIRIAELGGDGWSAPFNDEYLDATCIAVEPEGKWFAAGNIDKISVYELPDSDSPDPDPTCEIECDGSVTSLAISETGAIVAGDSEGKIAVWDMGSQSRIMELTGHQDGSTVNALALKQHMLASAGDDSTVRVWDIRSGQCLAVLHHREGSVALGVAMRFSGKRIVSAGSDGLLVWDLDAHGIR